MTELVPRVGLREDVAALCAGIEDRLRTSALERWCDGEPVLQDGGEWRIAWGLTLAAPVAVAAWIAGAGPVPLALVSLSDALFLRRVGRRARGVESGVNRALRDLDALAGLLLRWEQEAFDAPLLARLRDALGAGERAASNRVSLLTRRLHAAEQQRNLMFAPFGFLLLWPYHQARRLEAWRVEHGADVKGWLDAVAVFEALTALATYAFEHPGDPFPAIVDSPSVRFEGHSPLSPASGGPGLDSRVRGLERLDATRYLHPNRVSLYRRGDAGFDLRRPGARVDDDAWDPAADALSGPHDSRYLQPAGCALGEHDFDGPGLGDGLLRGWSVVAALRARERYERAEGSEHSQDAAPTGNEPRRAPRTATA